MTINNNEDVSESPIDDEIPKRGPKNQLWKKGAPSPNPKGRPPKGQEKKGKPRSRMRNTLGKLYELEAVAVEVIKEHLERKDAKKTEEEKSRLDVAKFVIKSIESYNNTCLREELAILGVREKNEKNADDLEDNQAVEDAATSRFSMEIAESTLKH